MGFGTGGGNPIDEWVKRQWNIVSQAFKDLGNDIKQGEMVKPDSIIGSLLQPQADGSPSAWDQFMNFLGLQDDGQAAMPGGGKMASLVPPEPPVPQGPQPPVVPPGGTLNMGSYQSSVSDPYLAARGRGYQVPENDTQRKQQAFQMIPKFSSGLSGAASADKAMLGSAARMTPSRTLTAAQQAEAARWQAMADRYRNSGG